MGWRFWEPAPFGDYVTDDLHYLPPRRLNLSQLQYVCDVMAREANAPYTVASGYPGGPTSLGDLTRQLPENLNFQVITRLTPKGAEPNSLDAEEAQLQLSVSGPCQVWGRGPSAARAAAAVAREWRERGRPRRTYSWIYPVAFLLAIAVAVAPLIVLWARGDLSLWLIPIVVVAVLTAFSTGVPHVRDAVRRHREVRRGLDLDLRPIQQVRLDREQARQRLKTGLVFAAIAAIPSGVIGAVLQAVLDKK